MDSRKIIKLTAPTSNQSLKYNVGVPAERISSIEGTIDCEGFLILLNEAKGVSLGVEDDGSVLIIADDPKFWGCPITLIVNLD